MLAFLRNGSARVAIAATLFGALAIGCSAILGLGDYDVGATNDGGGSDGNANDGSSNDGAVDSGADCNVDLTTTCYFCAPTETSQYLNACTDGTCVKFEESRIEKFVVDGGLPPLP